LTSLKRRENYFPESKKKFFSFINPIFQARQKKVRLGKRHVKKTDNSFLVELVSNRVFKKGHFGLEASLESLKSYFKKKKVFSQKSTIEV